MHRLLAPNRNRRQSGRWQVALALAIAAAAAVAVSGCGGSSSGASSTRYSAPARHVASAGNPPPEWAADANGWPAHNYVYRHPYAYAEWRAIDYRTSKVQKAA